MYLLVMDWCLWEFNPTASSRITFLSTSDHLCSRNRIHSIYLPIHHFYLNGVIIRPWLHQVYNFKRLYWWQCYLLRLNSPLPIHLHAVCDLLPLLQYLEAIQTTNIHKPSILDFCGDNVDLPSLLNFLLRRILLIAIQPPVASEWVQSVLNGDDCGQHCLLLRIREVYYRMVQPILWGKT